MSPLLPTRLLLGLTALTAFVGLVDAARGGDADLAFLFGILLGLVTVHALFVEWRRPVVSLRGDLFRWLRRRASLTGDRVPALTDRAVAAYRQSLAGDPSEAAEATSASAATTSGAPPPVPRGIAPGADPG